MADDENSVERKRAVVSCHDKRGLVDLAATLQKYDIEIISTAGTLETLVEAGIECTSLADYTGVPEMLDGRVKSLHSKIHAGLLGLRDNDLHCDQLQAQGYEWIDFVIVNLHPVESILSKPGIILDEVIDQIDIGGNAMIRSAAKNFRYVTVAVNHERYPTIIHELHAHEGSVSFSTRYQLATEAFAHTAQYDRVIADYLARTELSKD